MGTHVWVVDHGSYSDYSVDGIFSTKEKADEFARRYNLANGSSYEAAEVTEWEIDPELPTPVLKYIVQVSGSDSWHPILTPLAEPTYQTVYDGVSFLDNSRWQYATSRWMGQMSGPTPEHARKAAQDRVAEVKAKMAGLS